MTTTWDVFVEDTDSLLNILREGLGDQFSFIDVLDWLTSVGFVSFQVEIKIWWKYMAWKTLWLMSLNVFCRPCINRLYFEIKLYFRSINKWRRNEILRTRCNHNIFVGFYVYSCFAFNEVNNLTFLSSMKTEEDMTSNLFNLWRNFELIWIYWLEKANNYMLNF
jgi:hypothetical protein